METNRHSTRRRNPFSKKRYGIILLCLFIGAYPVFGLPARSPHLEGIEPDFTLLAESVIVYDADNDLVLYEQNADRVHSIASLTKIVTAYLALEAIHRGEFPLYDPIVVHPDAYANAQAPGSSLLFLGPGQRVTGLDLLYGLTVSSGNDAAAAIAIQISGSVEVFVQEMNNLARRFNYNTTLFADSSGLDKENRSTARELADLAARMYRTWGGAVVQLFSRPSFRFPHNDAGIVQYNRNSLLEAYEGVDGLKTGYTEEAGYTFVGSALQNDRRIIIVLLGMHAPTKAEGYRLRHEQARALFDMAFKDFFLYTISFVSEKSEHRIPVIGGADARVGIGLGGNKHFYLHASQIEHAQAKAVIPAFIEAPVQTGDLVAELELSIQDIPYVIGRLETTESAERAGLINRFLQWIRGRSRKSSLSSVELRIHPVYSKPTN